MKPTLSKSSPVTKPVKARRMWCFQTKDTRGRPGPLFVSHRFQYVVHGGPCKPCFVIPAEDLNAVRWQVEQTYLRCEDAEITDPWEIAMLVLKSIGITNRSLSLLPTKGRK